MFTYQRLEIRNRHVAVLLAKAAGHFEAALIDGRSIHSGIDESTDDSGAEAADRNKRFEFGDPFLQKLAMQRIFGAFRRRCVPAGSTPTAACSVGEP